MDHMFPLINNLLSINLRLAVGLIISRLHIIPRSVSWNGMDANIFHWTLKSSTYALKVLHLFICGGQKHLFPLYSTLCCVIYFMNCTKTTEKEKFTAVIAINSKALLKKVPMVLTKTFSKAHFLNCINLLLLENCVSTSDKIVFYLRYVGILILSS